MPLNRGFLGFHPGLDEPRRSLREMQSADTVACPSFQGPVASTNDEWYAAGAATPSTLGTQTYTSGRMFAVPQYFSRDTKIDKLGIEIVTGGASSVLRLAIYEPHYAWNYPGRCLAQTDSLSGASSGTFISDNVSAYLVGGRVYWFASFVSSGTAPVVRGLALGTMGPNIGATTLATNNTSGAFFIVPGGGPALPTPFPPNASKTAGIGCPCVHYHVAA